MKTKSTHLSATCAITSFCLAVGALVLSSCVNVATPYSYTRVGPGGGVEVIAPGTHVTVGGPGYVQVLPVGARPVVYRGEQCWFYGGRHYRRHGRGYAVFVP